MRKVYGYFLAAFAAAELILIFCWIGVRPQLRDGPLVLAKVATETNAYDAMVTISFAYHDAQIREQRLLIGQCASVAFCVMVLVVTVLDVMSTRRAAVVDEPSSRR